MGVRLLVDVDLSHLRVLPLGALRRVRVEAELEAGLADLEEHVGRQSLKRGRERRARDTWGRQFDIDPGHFGSEEVGGGG